jgi:hypothetical protein
MTPEAPSSDLIVRPARGADVLDIASRLRSEDIDEIAEASGESPVRVLGQAYVESERCWTVTWKGRPAAMFGVVRSPHVSNPRIGVVWLLGTDDVALFGYGLTKFSKEWLLRIFNGDETSQGFDILGNLVSENSVTHRRWLTRIGARMIGVRHNVGCKTGVPFHEFVFHKESLESV